LRQPIRSRLTLSRKSIEWLGASSVALVIREKGKAEEGGQPAALLCDACR
jgi:hypothetical protein